MSPEAGMATRDAAPVESIDAVTVPEMSSMDAGRDYDNDVSHAKSDMSTPPPSYPNDDHIRVNHLQALGTHNSYHLAPDIDFLP